jgi:hypothetical protein
MDHIEQSSSKSEQEEMISNEILKARNKHLKNWHTSRSAVAAMQNTKAYHMHLTVLSDQKANIVIAASSIIISVSISQLGRFDGILLYALMVITFFTTFALLFAILSVAPVFNKTKRKMTSESTGFNPLFFGHFSDISIEKYTETMLDMLQDNDKLYNSMILDIYQMGAVLKHQKFKYLSLSYKIFFIGILIGLIMFMMSIFV